MNWFWLRLAIPFAFICSLLAVHHRELMSGWMQKGIIIWACIILANSIAYAIYRWKVSRLPLAVLRVDGREATFPYYRQHKRDGTEYNWNDMSLPVLVEFWASTAQYPEPLKITTLEDTSSIRAVLSLEGQEIELAVFKDTQNLSPPFPVKGMFYFGNFSATFGEEQLEGTIVAAFIDDRTKRRFRRKIKIKLPQLMPSFNPV